MRLTELPRNTFVLDSGAATSKFQRPPPDGDGDSSGRSGAGTRTRRGGLGGRRAILHGHALSLVSSKRRNCTWRHLYSCHLLPLVLGQVCRPLLMLGFSAQEPKKRAEEACLRSCVRVCVRRNRFASHRNDRLVCECYANI